MAKETMVFTINFSSFTYFYPEKKQVGDIAFSQGETGGSIACFSLQGSQIGRSTR